MRILLLTTYFRPDLCSTGVIMTKLAEEFVSRGHEVTVVTSVPHYDRNRVWPEYSKKLLYCEQCNGMKIYRLHTYIAHDKANVLQRVLAYATFHLLSFVRAATLPAYDVILAPSPPLSNGVIADLVGRFRGTPFVYNVQDIWPDVAIRAGVLKNSKATRFLRGMEQYVYRRASKLAVISEGFQRNLLEKGVPGEKLSIIPNFIDTEFVTPVLRHNEFSEKHGLHDKFVVLFAGNMGFSQDLNVVLDAARLLQARADIQFLMVGNGALKNEAEEYCRALNLTNVRFLPYQEHDSVPSMYGTADVCLIPLKVGFTAESVPCKLFTIMAAAKPAIASVDFDSDTAKLITLASCGTVVEPENAAALALAIGRYRENPTERIVAGARGRNFVTSNFHASNIAESYLKALQSVISGESHLEGCATPALLE